MAVNANTQTVSAQSEEKQNMQESQTMPPQLRAARLGKQRIVKTIILTVTLLFLFVPLVSNVLILRSGSATTLFLRYPLV